MDDKRIKEAINARYSHAKFSEEKIRHVLQSIEGEVVVKKKISMAFVLMMILLIAAVTAIAAIFWPSFIKDNFVKDEPTVHVGMLALINQLQGTELTNEVVVDDVAMRTHYAVVEDSECAILFSLQNKGRKLPGIRERLFIAEVDMLFGDYAAGGRCNVTQWYDDETGTLYCLGSTMLEGVQLPSESNVEMTLSVISQTPVKGEANTFANGEPIWSVTTSILVGQQLPSEIITVDKAIAFAQTSLTITEIEFRATGATVRFEGEIALPSEGKPRSFLRMFGFVWCDKDGPIPLRLVGADSTNTAGKTLGEFSFQGTLEDATQIRSLNVWLLDNSDDVQTIAIHP